MHLIHLFNLDCGPPQTKVVEEDGCYTIKGVPVPCRTNYSMNMAVWKKCIPPYFSVNGKDLRFYICGPYGWFPRHGCFPGMFLTIMLHYGTIGLQFKIKKSNDNRISQ